jgi:hypothetical protein
MSQMIMAPRTATNALRWIKETTAVRAATQAILGRQAEDTRANGRSRSP